ncbi:MULTISPECIES: MCE family protein [unclassified Nocardia]|uniref:MCE family protein n=1 Tax=unclassified Nocardia TaxID=2637762 RepID=UPI001CE458D3|nr:MULTISPECIES: MCE family protein [unclassified Nocardia]
MSIRRPLIGFGLFAVVSVLVTAMIWNTLARPVPGATDTYTATFTDVLGLREGDDVRMAGVRVGKVDGIELDGADHARVRILVRRDKKLYGNTKALVRYQNLIGQRYIALEPGKDGDPAPLPGGATIPLARTEPSFEVSVLLNGFRPLFQVLSPDQVNNLSETLIQALQGDGVSLSAFITQAAALATDFRQRDTLLGDVITELSGVMSELARRGSELETLVTQTRALVNGLYEQGQSLQRSTTRIAEATGSVVAMLSRVQPQLAPAQRATRDALDLLLANGERLDRTAVDLPAIMADAGRFADEGTYTNAYMCRVDITLWGVLFPRGLISQIGGPAQSAVCRP